MKRVLTLMGCAALAAAAVSCTTPAVELKVVSYNIRNSYMPEYDGDNFWPYRREASVAMVETERPDLLGLQEACADQLAYLDAELPAYDHVGVGRDDGRAEGETMAIYYNTERLELEEWGTFWISETPNAVSLGWDGACRRTMTWGRFRFKENDRRVVYVNTHFDHVGAVAREEGIKLVVAKLAELNPEGLPVFLTADFNSPTDDRIFDPLKAAMLDARIEAPVTDSHDTFNGWGGSEGLIDHIFYNNVRSVKSFRTLTGDYGAPYISDHYPVEAVFTL